MPAKRKELSIKDFNIKESELSKLRQNDLNSRIEYMKKEIERLTDEITKQRKKKEIDRLSNELKVIEPILNLYMREYNKRSGQTLMTEFFKQKKKNQHLKNRKS